MRTILVMNSKGGCGKSMLATNLAVHYAGAGLDVVLADFDPQGSSLAWLKARGRTKPRIAGLDATSAKTALPRQADVVVLDAPAGVRAGPLSQLARRSQTILVPVLPSPTDMRATARFVHELLLVGKVSRKQTRVASIANRVPVNSLLENVAESVGFESLNTRVYRPLERFLARLKIPFIASLPDSAAYPLADQKGLSIFELEGALGGRDRLAWQPLLDWLEVPQGKARAT
jgi:chromosome partitioning protein